jgi:hypothetical protein
MSVDRLDNLTPQTPNESCPRRKQLVWPPVEFGRLASPLIEKATAVIKGELPLGFGHARRPVVIEPRPVV